MNKNIARELVKMAKSLIADDKYDIDIKPLEDKISSMVGVSIKLDHEVAKTRSGEEYIKIKSPNLVDKTGVFRPALKEVYIEEFGGGLKDNVFWISIHFVYKIKSGGSNGMDLLTAWYDINTKKWQFRD